MALLPLQLPLEAVLPMVPARPPAAAPLPLPLASAVARAAAVLLVMPLPLLPVTSSRQRVSAPH
jgi:hypothetical protein